MKKLTFILMTLFVANTVTASQYIACSTEETENGTCFSCGQKCAARLTYPNTEDALNQTNAILTFSGTGEMKKYYPDPTPWRETRGFVTKVVIEEGITSVEYDAFLFFEQITDAQLPSTLKVLAPGAFQGCTNLKTLEIPDGVDIQDVSLDASGLTSLVVSENSTISPRALYGVVGEAPLESIYCSSAKLQQCQDAVAYRGDNVKIKEYQKYGDTYYIDGKFYTSPNDIIGDHHIQKRIYTIDEANRVAGDKNRVSIKYR